MRFRAGQIVLVDCGDALPKEPNKRRPAVVVEDKELFDDAYPNLILGPWRTIPDSPLPSWPSASSPPENGCAKPCHALAHHVTTASKRRITATPSRVTGAQLADIRRLIALAIGVEAAAT